jgi:chemotaxis receptor (MCP) glutamine deamidase CheD
MILLQHHVGLCLSAGRNALLLTCKLISCIAVCILEHMNKLKGMCQLQG